MKFCNIIIIPPSQCRRFIWGALDLHSGLCMGVLITVGLVPEALIISLYRVKKRSQRVKPQERKQERKPLGLPW